MVDFVFTAPKQMIEEGSDVSLTFAFDRTADGGWMINNRVLNAKTVEHAVAFALKQQMANSYASVGTMVTESDDKKKMAADKAAKKYAPIAVRNAEFLKKLNEVFEKLCTHDESKLRSWETVFTKESGEAALSPFEAQMVRLVRAGLVAWAKAKGEKLPKMNTDEYKALAEKYRAKFKDRLESEAYRALEDAEADADDFDDFLAGDSEVGSAEESEEEKEE